MNDKKFLIAVVGAGLNKKGRLRLGTWWKIRNATELMRSLEESGERVEGIAIVPLPDSSDAWSRQRLQLALTQRYQGCDHFPIMPPMGDSLPRKDHVQFARSLAEQRGAYLVVK